MLPQGGDEVVGGGLLDAPAGVGTPPMATPTSALLAAGKSAGTGAGRIVGPQDLEVQHQVPRLLIGNGQALDVHDGSGELGVYQGIIPMVHIAAW